MHCRAKRRLRCVLMLLSSLAYSRRTITFSLLIIITVVTTIISYKHVVMNHVVPRPRGIQRNGYEAEPQIKISESRACVLPELDPFKKSALEDLEFKDTGPLECEGQIYTSLKDGVLSVKKDDNLTVELKEIRRVWQDDFEIQFYELPMVSQENWNISVLYEGFQGNIQHISKKCLHPFGGNEHVKPNTRAVLHADCGLKRIVFQLVKKKKGLIVKHIGSGLCLQPAKSDNSSSDLKELVFSLNCDPSFKVMSNGSLYHIASGLCVHTDNTTQDMENIRLVMNDCNNETGFNGINIARTRNVRINAEFVQVNIETIWQDLKEYHIQALPKPDVITRPIRDGGMGLNVLMIMFDSTSAAQFQRKMPKSLDFLTNEVNSIFFKGEGVVGDGTTAQLSAMLTGIAEENQVEARRGRAGAETVDDWNWIFQDFKNHGYATMFSEDDPKIATFNYRFLGFQDEPTDHYARPFWIAVERSRDGYCMGGEALHNMSFKYIQSFFNAYPRRPKFSLNVFSYITHSDTNALGYVDEDLVEFLRTLNDSKTHLNNSIVIIFGDHGYRFSKLRKSIQGKLEERLPFLSMTFPKWFPWKYPEVYSNLKNNAGILTSPFDVYATLRHVLSYPAQPDDIKTGQSLFNKIDERNRTCQQAGIDSHWCPCMQWEKIDSEQQISQDIAVSVVKHINNLTSSTNLCRPFKIKKLQSILKAMPNYKVQKFEKTEKIDKCDSCVPVYGKKARKKLSIDTLYQIQIVLDPGGALFEASVRVMNGSPVVDTRFISRINAYGNQPHCIERTHTDLVKYCYCKDQISIQ